MPFVAETQDAAGQWSRVDITTLETPKAELAGRSLRCPDADCGAALIVKAGPLVAAHFAHKSTPGQSCAFAGGGESAEHMAAKRMMLARLRRHPEYAGARIEPERILRQGDALKRIADVFVEFPDGWTEAHEAQLSRTTVAECQQRTGDYLALGVGQVIWWFGRANHADVGLQEWAVRATGAVGALDFELQRAA